MTSHHYPSIIRLVSALLRFPANTHPISRQLQIRCPDQHQHVKDHPTTDAATFDEAWFIHHLEQLIRAFISNDLPIFNRTFRILKSELGQQNLPILSARLTEIVQLWSSETSEMEPHDEKQRPRPKKPSATITSAFASRATIPAQSHDENRPEVAQQTNAPQPIDETTTYEGKGKGKMPALGVAASPWHSDYDTKVDLDKYSRSDAFLKRVPRQRASTSVDTCAPGPSSLHRNAAILQDSPTSHDDEHPNDSNDWGVEKTDGVLIGRPPEYPAGLLDWDDNDKGKKVADVVPDNLTRVKTVAASAASTTLRAAQGALQGLICSGAAVAGSSKDNQGQQKKKGSEQQEKKKKKSKQKKGKFVKTPREQLGPEHVYQYSDYYDSEDGSDWVTL